MSSGEFRHTERSVTVDAADDVRIELVAEDGDVTVLKESVKLLPGEIIDASVMSKRALVEFLEAQIADAKAQDVLLSVHLKATMMKVSDQIIFGHAVEAYFSALFDEPAVTFNALGASPNGRPAQPTPHA